MTELSYDHVAHPAASADAPTLLLLHGTGGSEHDLLPLARMLAPGAGVLSPRGNVLEHGMPRFFRRLAEGVFDTEDLVRRAGDLAAFVDEAADAYGFDRARVIAAGFSNGANIAGALLLLHPQVLRGAALFAPMVPLRPTALPDLSHAAVLVSAGRSDPICPPEQAEELAGLLSDAGAAVTLSWHPGGHELARTSIADARTWMDKLLAATAADTAPPLP